VIWAPLLAAAPVPDPGCAAVAALVADLAARVTDEPGINFLEPASPGLVGCPAQALPPALPAPTAAARALAAHHLPEPAGQRAFIYSIARPALSADGRQATVTVTVECTGLCGSGQTITLRLAGGRWTVSDRRTDWVS
jgi:hypothetical protein